MTSVPVLRVVEHPALAGQHVGHVGRVRHHHADHIGVTNGVGDRLRGAATRLDERRGLLRRAVVSGHLVARLREVDRHRAAHDAEADEGDVRHAWSSLA